MTKKAEIHEPAAPAPSPAAPVRIPLPAEVRAELDEIAVQRRTLAAAEHAILSTALAFAGHVGATPQRVDGDALVVIPAA